MLRYPTFVDQWPRRERRILTVLLVALLGGFLLLSLVVALLPTSLVDLRFTEGFQERRNPGLDSFMKFVSWFGYYPQNLIIVFGTALVFWLGRRRREAKFLVATLLALIPVFLMKLAFGRTRPRVELWEDFESGTPYQSFPSGHVALYVVFFGFLAFLLYRLRTLPDFPRRSLAAFALLLILLVPASRIYLGAHWFTDVMGGFVVGLLCLIGLCLWYLNTVHGDAEQGSVTRFFR